MKFNPTNHLALRLLILIITIEMAICTVVPVPKFAKNFGEKTYRTAIKQDYKNYWQKYKTWRRQDVHLMLKHNDIPYSTVKHNPKLTAF